MSIRGYGAGWPGAGVVGPWIFAEIGQLGSGGARFEDAPHDRGLTLIDAANDVRAFAGRARNVDIVVAETLGRRSRAEAVESLVVSVAVIVLDVLPREEAQVAVTERDLSPAFETAATRAERKRA